MILALDLATNTGWAFSKGTKILAWGVENFSSGLDTRHARGHRLDKFEKWLGAFSGVHEIIYEEVGSDMRNINAAACFYQLLGEVEKFAFRCRIPLTSIHNATLKKAFTGSGRADKKLMCETAHNLGWSGGIVGTDMDHDACDACALIYIRQIQRGVEMEFSCGQKSL